MIDQSNRPNRALLAEVVGALREIGLPDIVLVGAMARDIWLDELGGPSERATNDIDFGFGVRDWAAYSALRSILLERHGFASTNTEHRLKYRGHDIDLVPFGAIEGKDRSIVWPQGGTLSSGLMGDRALPDALLDAIAARVDRDLRRMRDDLSGLRPGIELDAARRGLSSHVQQGLQKEVGKALGNLEGRILKEAQEALSSAGVRLVAAHIPFIENRIDPILERTQAGMDAEFGNCRSLFEAARIRLARDLRIAAGP